MVTKALLNPFGGLFIEGRYQLLISEEIVYEYQEILQQHSAPGISEAVVSVFLESPDVIFQQVYYNWNAITSDPDDNKFFDIAVAANADYLVTDDRHFYIVKSLNFPSVKIISANEFLDIINSSILQKQNT